MHLTTYQSINRNDCVWSSPGVNTCGRHPVDATTNSHTSIRIINQTHNLLYAEFVNVSDGRAWNFREDVQFTALFDLDASLTTLSRHTLPTKNLLVDPDGWLASPGGGAKQNTSDLSAR